jgi:hypothetical protein
MVLLTEALLIRAEQILMEDVELGEVVGVGDFVALEDFEQGVFLGQVEEVLGGEKGHACEHHVGAEGVGLEGEKQEVGELGGQGQLGELVAAGGDGLGLVDGADVTKQLQAVVEGLSGGGIHKLKLLDLANPYSLQL